MDGTETLARGLTGGQTYSSFQWDLVLYALVVAGMALLASTIYAIMTRTEVSKKYRSASHASALICAVATVGYLVLILYWNLGFSLRGENFVPSAAHRFSNGFRYTDWTVTVPLLTVELLAVCSLAGAKARNLRATVMAAAFAMIVTGFIGNELNEGAQPNTAALVIWGLVSTAFYLYLYVALAGAVRASAGTMSAPAYGSLRNATILLFSVWGTYPLAYMVFIWTRDSAQWAVAVQLAFCAADITAKAGFGALIHKVAKLRTAEDAAAGRETLPDIYPEEVWVSHQKLSEPRHPLAMTDGVPHDGQPAAAAAGSSTDTGPDVVVMVEDHPFGPDGGSGPSGTHRRP